MEILIVITYTFQTNFLFTYYPPNVSEIHSQGLTGTSYKLAFPFYKIPYKTRLDIDVSILYVYRYVCI